VCAAEGIAFVLGHALAMKTIHGIAIAHHKLRSRETFQDQRLSLKTECPAYIRV